MRRWQREDAGAHGQHGSALIQRRLQRQPHAAGQRRIAALKLIFTCLAQAHLGHQAVHALILQRREREAGRIQRGQQANLSQQQQLKGAQAAIELRTIAQPLHSQRVRIKQLLMRIIARQQLHEQLIEVIAREQCIARGHGEAALPFGAFESLHLGIARKANLQRLQRQQHRAKLRTGALHTLSHQGHAPMMPREHFQNQATLAPRVLMQHKGALMQNALHAL